MHAIVLKPKQFNMCPFNRSTEATSYRAAIRTARGVVEDIGTAAAAKSGGLSELARVPETNSERGGHQVIAKEFNLALPIRFTKLKKADGVLYPGELTMLKLKDWFDYIVRHNVFHMLVGLYRADKAREMAILQGFWKKKSINHAGAHPVSVGRPGTCGSITNSPLYLAWGRGTRTQERTLFSPFVAFCAGLRNRCSEPMPKPQALCQHEVQFF